MSNFDLENWPLTIKENTMSERTILPTVFTEGDIKVTFTTTTDANEEMKLDQILYNLQRWSYSNYETMSKKEALQHRADLRSQAREAIQRLIVAEKKAMVNAIHEYMKANSSPGGDMDYLELWDVVELQATLNSKQEAKQ